MPMFKRKLEHKVPLDYNMNEPFNFGDDISLPSNAQFIENDNELFEIDLEEIEQTQLRKE